jgi:hypothetical protein
MFGAATFLFFPLDTLPIPFHYIVNLQSVYAEVWSLGYSKVACLSVQIESEIPYIVVTLQDLVWLSMTILGYEQM